MILETIANVLLIIALLLMMSYFVIAMIDLYKRYKLNKLLLDAIKSCELQIEAQEKAKGIEKTKITTHKLVKQKKK